MPHRSARYPTPCWATSTRTGKVCQLYGVYNADQGTAVRSIFVVDKEGTVRWKRTYTNAADVDPKDVLAEIDKL